ncbi:MAG: Thymidylate synthase [Trizodia sp. TS-e1964]|nr:MAG: Thymidylate synthase [Trizodia sp. TS-e1964]
MSSQPDTTADEMPPTPKATTDTTPQISALELTAPLPSITPTIELAQHEEHQYLSLIRSILAVGEHRPDRTGTGTLSLFAPPALKFTLTRSPTDPTPILPLLTTKRVFLRGVLGELLWLLSGTTSTLPLSAAGIKIWDGNSSRAFLDSVGLPHRAVGDLGPVYGFQWRHFGAPYIDASTDYTGQGVDQIRNIVRQLLDTPYDRRILLSAWNPAALPAMALPPCHVLAQFYVSQPGAARGYEAAMNKSPRATLPPAKGVLHTHLYQRSADMGLGIPFNIASYALLTHMLAHACNLQPGSLTHALGDAHIYLDHVDALREQVGRAPRAFPEVRIKRDDRGSGVMEGWVPEDVEVLGYQPHAGVRMNMSV